MTAKATITVLPRAARRHQGNPAYCAFCPKCRERTLQTDDGKCLWCSTMTVEAGGVQERAA
jgi:hypothetical protein